MHFQAPPLSFFALLFATACCAQDVPQDLQARDQRIASSNAGLDLHARGVFQDAIAVGIGTLVGAGLMLGPPLLIHTLGAMPVDEHESSSPAKAYARRDAALPSTTGSKTRRVHAMRALVTVPEVLGSAVLGALGGYYLGETFADTHPLHLVAGASDASDEPRERRAEAMVPVKIPLEPGPDKAQTQQAGALQQRALSTHLARQGVLLCSSSLGGLGGFLVGYLWRGFHPIKTSQREEVYQLGHGSELLGVERV